MPSPEELAREKIDALLQQCGWLLQNRSTINLSASRGVAIREALLKDRDEVDYLLFVDGKAIGTVEIAEDLQAALAQFAEIANDLKTN
jgi:type I restriction enzyme R subunit